MSLRPIRDMRFLMALLILATSLRADALAGAWETFSSESNADAWSLYSYDDGLIAPPPWAASESDDNPYAYSFFLGGEGVWFFADGYTAQRAFVGDYAEQKIAGVDVSVSVDPAEIDYIDLVVYADGPNGLDYYYSLTYRPEDLGELPDWYELSFSFDESWFSLQNGTYTAFQPDQDFLASIGEIGVRFFPAAGVTGDGFVGLDDFILVPTVEAPTLATSLSGGSFALAFTPNPGVSATIEKLTSAFAWQAVSGKSGLTGPQTYTTPIVPGASMFRVAAREKLTQVSSP